MKRNHYDKAKVAKSLLKLKQTTDIYNYIKALDNAPLKSTLLCLVNKEICANTAKLAT